eukprot:1185136-Prorocentrum_minimum.AAC.2
MQAALKASFVCFYGLVKVTFFNTSIKDTAARKQSATQVAHTNEASEAFLRVYGFLGFTLCGHMNTHRPITVFKKTKKGENRIECFSGEGQLNRVQTVRIFNAFRASARNRV